VYVWDGGWIAVGTAPGVVPLHAHHAVQVTLGLTGRVAFRPAEGPWIECAGAVVLPNAPHSFDGRMAFVAMLFLDPECREGRRLRHTLRSPIHTVPKARYASFRRTLLDFQERRPSADEAAHSVAAVARSLCEGSPPDRGMDERIAKALVWIRARDPQGLSQEQVAREVYLSTSRFAHLFTTEVGLPFRRYLLWRKVGLAIGAFARGGTLSTAAHAAGFADSAHLTRTFHQMFGLAPSVMIGTAEFSEIPAPFDLTLQDA
jgi:AraC-like DNA-binding protein